MDSTKTLEGYLEGARFPCDRDGLEEAAKRNDAPGEVLHNIRELPDGTFRDRREVQEAVDALRAPSGV